MAPYILYGDTRVVNKVMTQTTDEDIKAGIAEKIGILPQLTAEAFVFHDFIQVLHQHLQHAALAKREYLLRASAVSMMANEPDGLSVQLVATNAQ